MRYDLPARAPWGHLMRLEFPLWIGAFAGYAGLHHNWWYAALTALAVLAVAFGGPEVLTIGPRRPWPVMAVAYGFIGAGNALLTVAWTFEGEPVRAIANGLLALAFGLSCALATYRYRIRKAAWKVQRAAMPEVVW